MFFDSRLRSFWQSVHAGVVLRKLLSHRPAKIHPQPDLLTLAPLSPSPPGWPLPPCGPRSPGKINEHVRVCITSLITAQCLGWSHLISGEMCEEFYREIHRQKIYSNTEADLHITGLSVDEWKTTVSITVEICGEVKSFKISEFTFRSPVLFPSCSSSGF